jgi:hypothetical protein
MFFETTVTSQVYIELFREFVDQLNDQELKLGYYQQDGATSHTSGVSMAEVESFFPDGVIFPVGSSKRECLHEQTTHT